MPQLEGQKTGQPASAVGELYEQSLIFILVLHGSSLMMFLFSLYFNYHLLFIYNIIIFHWPAQISLAICRPVQCINVPCINQRTKLLFFKNC